ncbi:MAG: M12 family metallo-peptidase [Thermodesulfobacteriota bacterium]
MTSSPRVPGQPALGLLVLLVLGAAWSLDRTVVSSAPDPARLFQARTAADWSESDLGRLAAWSRETTVLRGRLVRINSDSFQTLKTSAWSETITLNLFDDLVLTAVHERLEKAPLNRVLWFGRLKGEDRGQVIMVLDQGNLTAVISRPGGLYEVRPLTGGTHVIREIDQSKFEREAPARPAPPPDNKAAGLDSRIESTVTIDVAVAYTQDAAADSGNIANDIILAVADANQAYVNSGINQRLNLVDTKQVNYAESGDVCVDLDRLRDSADGDMDDLHDWRDSVGADCLVLMVKNGSGYVGCAYQMSVVDDYFAAWAFSVVRLGAATANHTFAHELGHNMGARHDCDQDALDTPYVYAHGYLDPNHAWRTIMAYASSFNETRIPYFSNPDLLYGGEPLGEASGACQADNRGVLNNTASTVAAFRTSTGGASPSASSGGGGGSGDSGGGGGGGCFIQAAQPDRSVLKKP